MKMIEKQKWMSHHHFLNWKSFLLFSDWTFHREHSLSIAMAILKMQLMMNQKKNAALSDSLSSLLNCLSLTEPKKL